MRVLCNAQKHGRPRLPLHIFHATLLIFLNIVPLEYSRCEGSEEFDLVRMAGGTRDTNQATLHATSIPEELKHPVKPNNDDGKAMGPEAQSYLRETHAEGNRPSPRDPQPHVDFNTDHPDEHTPLLEKNERHDGPPSGDPKGIKTPPDDQSDSLVPGSAIKRGRGISALLSRFWAWLTKSRIEPKPGGRKFPINHLKDPMKGPWHRSPAFKISPRPPTRTGDERMITLEILGKRLRENYDAAVAQWVEDLKKAKAVELRQKVLSTKLFLQLTMDYREQTETAVKYQGYIKKMCDNLIQEFGANKLKGIFKEIETKYKEQEKTRGLMGLKLDPDYCTKPLSPLLLLVEDGGKDFQAFLAKENVVNGHFPNGVGKMDYLSEQAEKYAVYVKHFQKTRETQKALEHYIEESGRLEVGHQPHEAQVLHYFEHLDINRLENDNFLGRVTQLELGEDAVESLMRQFPTTHHRV